MTRSAPTLFFFALAAGVLSGVPASAAQAAGQAGGERALQEMACPVDTAPALAGRMRCGQLVVPENRAVRGGRTVTVPFAEIQPAQQGLDRAPLLFVMGGNGSGLKVLKRRPELGEMLARETRVIFVDHRGSAPWATPYMACESFPEGLDAANADADPTAVEACRAHLAARLDLNLYGPWESAQDLRDLRLALGLPRWDVYGVSYGTTIAQRLLTVDGEGIASIVLDGMSGADSNSFSPTFLLEPLLDVLDECAAAPDCAAAYPRFEQELGEVAAQLAREPREIGGVKVSNVEYLGGIRIAMGDPERRGRIPLAVARSARGDFGAWQEIAARPEGGRGKDPAFTWPGSVCRDEHARRNDPDRALRPSRALPEAVASGVRFGASESWDWDRFCPRMGFVRSAEETVRIVRSGVPALMLVGQLDLVTPKLWNDQTVRHFDDARTVVFPLTGHWALLNHPECATDMVLGFFADPTAPLERRCVDALPTTRWARE